MTYLKIQSLDVEVIMEVELNELKNVCIILFKGLREKQLIELNECRTLTIKFVIIRETITSIEKTVYGNNLNVFYVSMWLFTLRSTNWIMGRKIIAVEKVYSKQLENMTMKRETSQRQRHLMTNSKDH